MFEERIVDPKLERLLKSQTGYWIFDEKNFEMKHQYEDSQEYIPKNYYSRSLNDYLYDQSFSFTHTSPDTQVLIGEDVISLDINDGYQIHRPIVNGYLNVKDG